MQQEPVSAYREEDTVPEPLIVPAHSARVRAACAISSSNDLYHQANRRARPPVIHAHRNLTGDDRKLSFSRIRPHRAARAIS
jgi:hypothetical protein